MPTVNPRINVTLPPSLDVLVARLAALQRVSKSQVLRELLEAAEPVLKRAVSAMEASTAALMELREGNRFEQFSDSAVVLRDGRLVLVDQADLVSQAESVIERRPAARARKAEPARGPQDASGSPNPPASNRGVKSPKTRGPRGPVRSFPLPPAKVQAFADTNGVPPKPRRVK